MSVVCRHNRALLSQHNGLNYFQKHPLLDNSFYGYLHRSHLLLFLCIIFGYWQFGWFLFYLMLLWEESN